MKDNKTIGFDILDNAGLDKIDQIGTDTDMLDEKTKKRILEMTRKRFNDAIKGEDMMTFNNDINESAEIVENVEVYKRSKISKIMTRVINTAAVAGIAAGSVFLVKNINRDNKPVEPDLPAVSSTEDGELTAEEKARNQRIEEYIQELYNQFGMSDEDRFYDCLKIDYAYLDINNDSVDELFIRYDFLEAAADAKGIGLNYFDGTKYVHSYNVSETFKIDLNNRKLYDLAESHEGERWLDINTWENVEFSADSDFFTLQDNYFEIIDSFAENTYTHNNEPCTKEEYDKAIAEYENCVSAELKFFPYDVKKANGQLSQEEIALNKRIEDYIQYLYECYGDEGENFYESLKIDYAYLDINNDSVDELLIRYHNLNDFSPYYEGTEINYFDGTKYIPVGETNTTFKFDLQNRKLYQLSEGHEGGYWLGVRTWDEFSDDTDFFTLTDNFTSDIISFEPLEYTYSHNDTECSMEEYEKAMDEYENCVGAELKFVPYNVKKTVSSSVQTQAVATNNEETIQTTIATINKPTQEVLDKARDAALKARFDKHNKNNYVSMYYAYYDINDDSVPELIIDNEFNLHWEMEIYKFNSTDFEFKTSVEHTQGVILCKSEKSIVGNAKTPSMVTNICYYNDELEFGSVDKWILGYNYDENGNMYDEYKHNDTVITEEEYRAHVHNCDNCVFFNDVEFLLYHTNNLQGNEEIAREKLFINKYSPRDYPTAYYAHTDLNSDGKSELVVLCRDENNIETVEMYSFNGDEYVFLIRTTGIFKLDLANNRLFSGFADGDDIKYIVVKTWDSECNLTTLKSISQTDEGFKETVAEYEACEGVNLEYNQCW